MRSVSERVPWSECWRKMETGGREPSTAKRACESTNPTFPFHLYPALKIKRLVDPAGAVVHTILHSRRNAIVLSGKVRYITLWSPRLAARIAIDPETSRYPYSPLLIAVLFMFADGFRLHLLLSTLLYAKHTTVIDALFNALQQVGFTRNNTLTLLVTQQVAPVYSCVTSIHYPQLPKQLR